MYEMKAYTYDGFSLKFYIYEIQIVRVKYCLWAKIILMQMLMFTINLV